MRVALLTNFIPPYRVSLYRALAKQVGELRLFVSTTMERNRNWEAEWAELDVVVQASISLTRTWKTSEFEEPYELHVPYNTLPLLSKYKPDIIIAGEMGARSLQALTYAGIVSKPIVLWATLSDLTEEDRDAARNMLRKFMVPRFRAVIVNGEAGARYIRRFRADEPTRVPYTTDMTPFLALPLEGRAREVLFVGAKSTRKGYDLLQGQTITEVTGEIAYEELPGWYSRAGFLIMPSRVDEWGVVVNEALASGVPVIGSVYSQAVDELIVDGYNGWRFQPDSANAVAQAISRATSISDDELLRMRHNARDSVKETTPEHAARKIADLLKSL